ncbi:hypothetical protein Glove_815540g4 [Diversispora epigaea]|uniref:Uncharacterized protein n=1 Tax=Diversispora epigaea TaxID=1348612 RepID=A0A397G131_9GLOM|nr:hypothetical protein Glove_815540g4 [Diversispora epigaea]
MEVIQKDLYVYAVETSYVDVFTDKKEVRSSSQSTSEPLKSVRLTLFIAHQDISENSSKVSMTEDHNNDRELMENETHEHIDFNVVEDGYMFECNKGYAGEDTELGKSAVNQCKKNEHNHEKVNNKINEHIDSYVVEDIEYDKGESSEPGKNVTDQNKKKEYNSKKVYNTRKRAEMFKNGNDKNDEKSIFKTLGYIPAKALSYIGSWIQFSPVIISNLCNDSIEHIRKHFQNGQCLHYLNVDINMSAINL